ncbi:hypothetical protein F5X97DRAFT_340219 [Nemania serpens]|nr:hypothetical protein F5X97DRAFT_340219 [Nemania serpens]
MTFLEDPRHVRSHFPSPRQRPRKKQSPSCFLLNLPVDLFPLIGEFLDAVDLALLALTCCSLRILFQKHAAAGRLSSANYRLFLVVLARGSLGRWACLNCMTIHPIIKHDTPSATYYMASCPAQSITKYGRPHISFISRHYARLRDREYAPYFRALMAPYHDPSYAPTDTISVQLKTHYSAYPRIVAGHGGELRYLLYSTRQYFNCAGDTGIRLLRHMGSQVICRHLELNCQFDRRPGGDPRNILEAVVEEALGADGDGRARADGRLRRSRIRSVLSQFPDQRLWPLEVLLAGDMPRARVYKEALLWAARA